MKNNAHYLAIKEFYGDKRAERSGVLYINHIDEGIVVLDEIGASIHSIEAYCLHPIFQSDEAIKEYCQPRKSEAEVILSKHDIPSFSIILAMEYRRVANSYLSFNKREDLVSCPVNYVKEMLIADKIQNRKDFEIYHKGKHPRSAELTAYFDNWMEILGISEGEYQRLAKLITS